MKSDLFYYKVTLHVSGVTAHIIRSTKNCSQREVSVPEATVTDFSIPDDGRSDTRNM